MQRILLAVLIALPGAAWAQVYEGLYYCGQGQSRLVLRVQERASNLAPDVAVFEFGPSASNPSQPNGSYTVSGMLTDTVINLQPVSWINQPPDYLMVGLNGTSSDQGRTYRGTIAAAAPGCSSFTLTRVRER